jgi:UDP-N-acetylmuramate--alanine ligase
LHNKNKKKDILEKYLMKNQNFIINTELQKRLELILNNIPNAFVFINIKSQLLSLIKNSMISEKYPISTSRFGTGNKEGSFKTPLGIHRIIEKIGDGAPSGRIFKSRKDTGENWQKQKNEENMILTRILRLEGLEPGVNKGGEVDSYKRYIYIHGTNLEDQLGMPTSHGCICMKSKDIINLFEKVGEGTIVIIN